jgi:hypothetical protein
MPKYAVQVVTDNKDQKADLFETLEEAVRYYHQLVSEGFEVKVYILGPLNVITKDQQS